MSTTHAAVIVNSSAYQNSSIDTIEDIRADLIGAAVSIFDTVVDLDRFYYSALPNTNLGQIVFDLSTGIGTAQLEDRLNETIESREIQFNKILETLEETDTPRQAAQSTYLMRKCHQVGSWAYPSTYLYDGTSYSRGRPIITQDYIDELFDYIGKENLCLVELTLEF